jgi:hypothetical protein
MILKLWFGSHAGRTSGFCLKSWVLAEGWSWIFNMPHQLFQPPARHGSNKNPSHTIQKHPLDVSRDMGWFEAMIWPSCWWDIWILSQKLGVGWAEFSTWRFTQTSLLPDMDPIKTLPKPSKSIHWMYQVIWDDFEAMIWPSCWSDIWILSQKLGVGWTRDKIYLA